MSENLAIPYVDPTQINQRGVFSYPLKLSLKPGQLAYAKNLRFFRDCWTFRKASRPIGASGGTKPSGWNANWKPRGMKVVTPNGNTLIVAAFADDAVPSQVQVYTVSQLGVWTHINSGSTWDDDGSWLYASEFSDLQSGTDYVVFGTAASNPRVWNGSTTPVTGIVRDVAPPQDSNIFRSLSGMTASFTVATGATTTFTNSSAQWTGADAGTGSDTFIQYTRTTTAATNPTSLVTFTVSADATNARQFMLYVQSTYIADWLEYVKVELYDGTNYYTVHDPASSFARGLRVEGLATGDEVWAFSLDAPAAGFLMNAVTGYRLTFTGSAPTAIATLNVLAACFGGKVPGGAQYAVSYFNSATRCESRSLSIATASGVRLDAVGGGEWGGLRFPISPVLYYRNTVGYVDTSSTENGYGVDRVRVYRADAALDAEGTVTYEANALLVTTRNFVTAGTSQTYTDNVAGNARLTEIGAPSPYCQSLPKSTDALGANGRMFALGASASTDTSGRYNTLWVSEDQQPMRFQQVVAYGFLGGLDDRSATRSKLEGDIGKRIVGIATADIGILTVFVFGRNAVYTMPGNDAFALSQPKISSLVGTNQALSVAVYQNEMFWLGTDNQIRRGSASRASDISSERIEDQIPAYAQANVWAAAGTVCQNNYYLAISPSTENSNVKDFMLVYGIEDDRWHGVDAPAGGKSFDAPVSLRSDLLYVLSGLDGTIVRHDGGDSLTDQDSAGAEQLVSASVTTHEEAADQNFETGLSLQRVECISDDFTVNCIATATPVYTPDGTASGSASVNLNVASGQVWRVGRMPFASDGDPNRGYSMYLTIAIVGQATKNIYRFRALADRRSVRPSAQ